MCIFIDGDHWNILPPKYYDLFYSYFYLSNNFYFDLDILYLHFQQTWSLLLTDSWNGLQNVRCQSIFKPNVSFC